MSAPPYLKYILPKRVKRCLLDGARQNKQEYWSWWNSVIKNCFVVLKNLVTIRLNEIFACLGCSKAETGF